MQTVRLFFSWVYQVYFFRPPLWYPAVVSDEALRWSIHLFSVFSVPSQKVPPSPCLPLNEIRTLTGAREVTATDHIQSLWSGYGQIVRVALDGAPAIVKHISPPGGAEHPRGWNTDRSHQRKLRSYEVEAAFYTEYASRCPEGCRVAKLVAASDSLLVLEDLDTSGFPARGLSSIDPCLKWLAHFHRTFLGSSPGSLWGTGTYWHLDTRPDELAAMPSGPLKTAATAIDTTLKNARFQTLVHGDAKLANFCFAPDGTQVAAVDFQYVGGGIGVKDLAYYLGSVLSDFQCEREIPDHLDTYFAALGLPEVEAEWRPLFPLAWADFHRFLAGWCPGHPKMTHYSDQMAHKALAYLEDPSRSLE